MLEIHKAFISIRNKDTIMRKYTHTHTLKNSCARVEKKIFWQIEICCSELEPLSLCIWSKIARIWESDITFSHYSELFLAIAPFLNQQKLWQQRLCTNSDPQTITWVAIIGVDREQHITNEDKKKYTLTVQKNQERATTRAYTKKTEKKLKSYL